jgi:signal transduction histidine kinase
LARVLENLLSNAAKYSPPESRIGVRAERDGDEVIISVTDEGPGVSEEDAQRIFDQFQRLESARQLAHGNGVGLSAVRQLVGLMHGRVWVDSVLGRGSAFRFTLPAATGA